MYSKQFFFKNNTKFNLVNLKLTANEHLISSKEMVHVYDGLKNFYTFENNKKALKFDLKNGLYILDRYKHKPFFNAFYYSSFFFPKNSMKARYIYSFFFKKQSLRMHSFIRLTRRLNRLLVVGLIKKINNINMHSQFLLRNYIVGKLGNYKSGFVLTSFGLSGLFLRFRYIWGKPFIFSPKRVFYGSKYYKVEKAFIKLLENSFNRLLFYYDYLAKLHSASKFTILFLFKFIFKEFKHLRFFFRLFLSLRTKAFLRPLNNYRFKSISKLLKIVYPIYMRVILKSYRSIFSVLLLFFRSSQFLLNNSFIYLFSSAFSINNQNFFLRKRISGGFLTNFISGDVERGFIFKSSKRLLKKLFNFYKYFLDGPNSFFDGSNGMNQKDQSVFKLNFVLDNSFGNPLYKLFNGNYYLFKKNIFSTYNYVRFLNVSYFNVYNKHFYLNSRRLYVKKNFYKMFNKKKGFIVNRLFSKKYLNFKKKLKLKSIVENNKQNYFFKLITRYRNYVKKFRSNFNWRHKQPKPNKSNKPIKLKRRKFKMHSFYYCFYDKKKKRKVAKFKRYVSRGFRFLVRNILNKNEKFLNVNTVFFYSNMRYRQFWYKYMLKYKKRYKWHRFNLHHLKFVDISFHKQRLRINKNSYYNDTFILHRMVTRYMDVFPSGKTFLKYEHLTYDHLFYYFSKFEHFKPFDKVGYYAESLHNLFDDYEYWSSFK